MFVENDHGTWRVWVLTESNGPNVEALDFFSGERQQVNVKLVGDGYQEAEFTDKNGKVHRGAHPSVFRFTTGTLPGLNFNTGTLRLSSSDSRCSLTLDVTDITADSGTVHKVPLYHFLPSQPGCAGGDWESLLGHAIDLNDGTFLTATQCWVFRLHKADLSPAGSAPSLHVVDASDVQAAIAKAKDRPIEDAATYLTESLHLSIDEKTSCKEN